MPRRLAPLVLLFAVGCETQRAAVKADEVVVESVEQEPELDVSRKPVPEAYRVVIQAELRLMDGDIPGAIELLRESTLHDPDSPYLHARLGQLYLKTGDVERALAEGEKSIKLDPTYLEGLQLVAVGANLSGDKNRARRTLETALEISPGHRPSSTLLAEILLENGEITRAERVIETLMLREPDAIDGFLSLANLFRDRGELEPALRHTEHALKRDRRSIEALELKIDLLYSEGKFEEALLPVKILERERGDSRYMRQKLLSAMLLAGKEEAATSLVNLWLAEDASPSMVLLVSDAYETAGRKAEALSHILTALDVPGTRSDRLSVRAGRLLMEAGRNAEAARQLCDVEANASDPDWASYIEAMCARAKARAGDVKGAHREVKSALSRMPHAARLLDTLRNLRRRDAKEVTSDEVWAAVKSAREAVPGDIDVLEVEIQLLEDEGRPEVAEELIQDLLREHPFQAANQMLFARFLDRRGDAVGAVAVVERVIARSERPTQDQLNFAAYTLADKKVRVDEALVLARRAVMRDPLNGYIIDTLGWAQYQAGDLDGALATLERANLLAPREAEILFHLAAVERARSHRRRALEVAEQALGIADVQDPVRPKVEALLAELREAK